MLLKIPGGHLSGNYQLQRPVRTLSAFQQIERTTEIIIYYAWQYLLSVPRTFLPFQALFVTAIISLTNDY